MCQILVLSLWLGLAVGNITLFLGNALGMSIPSEQRPSFASVLKMLTEFLATRLLCRAQKRKTAQARIVIHAIPSFPSKLIQRYQAKTDNPKPRVKATKQIPSQTTGH